MSWGFDGDENPAAGESRLDYAKQAFLTLNQQIIDAGFAGVVNIKVVPFSGSASDAGSPEYDRADDAALESFINGLSANGNTQYESPLQMLCDSPSVYRREAATTRFISRIPTTWDETQALDAKVAEYLLVARRKGNAWYVGAMTNEEPRSLVVDWSFLPEGEFLVEIFADGINADRHAEDYKMKEIRVSSGDRTGISLAPGGGWTAIVSPKGE